MLLPCRSFCPEILMFPSTLFLPARKKRLLFSGSSTCGFELLKISCNYNFCRNSSTVMLATKQSHPEIHQQNPQPSKNRNSCRYFPYFSDKILQRSSKNHPIFIFQTSQTNFATLTPSLGGVPPAEGALVQE